jgi:RNA polymerase sigma-70 factor (ECF subfamily)
VWVVERSDAELIEAVQRGEDQALGALLSRHAPGVYRFGLKMCRDPEDAKDVLQDTLLAAARGIREFRGASSLSTWLYTIARSFCIKKRRGAMTSALVSLDDEPGAAQVRSNEVPPDDAAETRELGAALEGAIASLAPMYREVVLLRDVEGLSAVEVAEVLELTVDAVKSRLHRARADVRSKLTRFLPSSDLPSSDVPSSATCPNVVAMFSRYLEGDIGAEECAAMERHIASCKRCNVACDSLKRTLALCRAQPRGEVPAEVQARVRKALHDLSGERSP